MRDDALFLAALKYAAGELGPIEAAGFELKLADDPNARELLAEAVRLSAAAIGQPGPMPDPLLRQSTLESLRPVRSFAARLFARRPYRGHPLTWTGAGAGAMAVLGSILWLTYPSNPCGECQTQSLQNFVAVNPTVVPSPIPSSPEPPLSATSSTAGMRSLEKEAIRPMTVNRSSPLLKPLGKG